MWRPIEDGSNNCERSATNQFLIERTEQVEAGQVDAQVELQLIVVRFHVFTELVKGLVVILFFQVSQFMHHDHAQKFHRCSFENTANADLVFRFQLTALHPRDEGMQAKGVMQNIDLVVEDHLADWWGFAQKLFFQFDGEIVQRSLGFDLMSDGKSLQNDVAKPLFVDQFLHLDGHLFRVTIQIFQLPQSVHWFI